MQTNLVGQYVVDGYGEPQRQEIVAVYVDRGQLMLVSKNSDDNLVLREAEHCKVSQFGPCNTSFQCNVCQWWSATPSEAEECCS